MAWKKIGSTGTSEFPDAEPVSPAQVTKVREILLLFANAVQAAKIFPPDHQTVLNFASDFHAKLRDYLDRYYKLELGIEEQAFTFAGNKVYKDPHPVKSLPFFFFKDGMQTLYFYRGLAIEEVKAFLETIRKISQLPPEEGDIVSALWEQDFANIRYVAPDDFLETRIGVGRPPLEIHIDREEFSRGRIDLAPEDLEEIRTGALKQTSREPMAGIEAIPTLPEELNLLLGPSDEKELEEIEALLLSSRRISSEEEYQGLVTELLCLEERKDQWPGLAAVLKEIHHIALQKKDYGRASRLLTSLYELKDAVFEKDGEKAAFIDSLIVEMGEDSLLAELHDSLEWTHLEDIDPFLDYLSLLGARAGRLAASIFEVTTDPLLRQKVLDILEAIGKKDPRSLILLAQDSKPCLTKEIIRLIGQLQERIPLSFLVGFLRSQNKDIKLEAIRALGQAGEEAADKILIGFLSDGDETVRIAALQSPGAIHASVLPHLLALTRDKAFKKKNLTEIKAAFDALARSGSLEAGLVLKSYLQKCPWWSSTKKTQVARLAATALSAMPLPWAREALREGSKAKFKKVRRACLEALSSLRRDDSGFESRTKR